MSFEPEVEERVSKLEEKYARMGQDMKSYLDGLLYADPLNYWDYIQTDVLLNLQRPKTDFPDEHIFIMYHQITELYFKLTLHELEQIAHGGRDVSDRGEDCGWKEDLSVEFFITRMKRANNYFKALITSFSIMVDGMEREQFLRFRMALLPASGFQSAQYRMIEICSTNFTNLVQKDFRDGYKGTITDSSIEQMYQHIYWRKGAIEKESGKKTLTLKQFEKKYDKELIALAKEYRAMNLLEKYNNLSKEDQNNEELITELRQFDVNVNINWPLSHYKSAVRYLQTKGESVAATGGTNWQQYLPPRFQRRIFYPSLWSESEHEEWGKKWVDSVLRDLNND